MVDKLKERKSFNKRNGPVVLVVMDGVGYGKYDDGDAVRAAYTPNLDHYEHSCPHVKLQAHGTAVGLPSDGDMGNSEVGHNAIGCGRVYAQGAKRVFEAINSGDMFKEATWKKLVQNAVDNNGAMHFIGLFSDGNVHSNISHLRDMIRQAKKDGVKKVRVHALLDGRDVGETSALEYIDPFEEFLGEVNTDGFDARIASGGGRMVITMDRYGANWDMVRKGWETHVQGKGDFFSTAHEAVEKLRERTEAIDQDLPPFVIAEGGKPIGPIVDGDSVIFYNYRGDRAIEITAAFEEDDFDKFDRGKRPDVEYAGMMEYDGDLHVPKQYLVTPPSIGRTVSEFLSATDVKQYAISETQKFGHVTYFYNGNRSGKFNEKYEEYVEILSDVVPFEQRPWMKSAEITDKVIEVIKSGQYDYIRLNYPNGDMVGHTGNWLSVICAMEALDISIGRLGKAIAKAGGIMILTADHGNSDDMYEHDKKTGAVKIKENGAPKSKTAHSLNPVPCILFDPDYKNDYDTALNEELGISSLGATVINLLGYEAPSDYDKSIINFK